MKKQITRFSVVQSARILAVVTFIFSVVFIVPVSLLLYYMSGEMSILTLFVIPFAYMAAAFFLGMLWFWIYNKASKTFGGFEFTLED